MAISYKLLKPGRLLPAKIHQEIRLINAAREKDFPEYIKNLKDLFGHKKQHALTDQYKSSLAGFVLGEGSINVSAKKIKGRKSPERGRESSCLRLDLEFSVTQHANKASILIDLCVLFDAGHIRHKKGSNATLVFTISNRKIIGERVIPFYESYLFPYMTNADKQRFFLFSKLHSYSQNKLHLNRETFSEEMLPLWDALRQQKGQKNESFPNLEAAQLYYKACFIG